MRTESERITRVRMVSKGSTLVNDRLTVYCVNRVTLETRRCGLTRNGDETKRNFSSVLIIVNAIASIIFPPFCWMWTPNYVVRIGLPVVFRCQAFYSCTSFVMILYVCSSWLNEVCFEVEHIICTCIYFLCVCSYYKFRHF